MTEPEETFIPYKGLLPTHHSGEPSRPANGSFLEDECWGMHVAILRRLALPQALIEMLDGATRGAAFPYKDLSPFLPSDANELGVPERRGKWDGTVDGYVLSMPEECLWTTLRDWYGWSIPSLETVEAIRDRMGITDLLEFGQGTGYFASVLDASGVKMTTSECFNMGYDGIGVWRRPDFNDSAEMFAANPEKPVLISWPDPVAENVTLSLLRPGQKIILTGARDRCGLRPSVLQARGFVRDCQASMRAVVPSMTGGLNDLDVWRAPG